MTMTCLRPGCDKPLNKGRKYCSNTCSAIDRNREKSKSRLSIYKNVPESVTNMILEQGGENANLVLREIALFLEEESSGTPVPPLMNKGLTLGDWTLSIDGRDYRPYEALSYEKIKDMLRCGAVKFALEMKIAGVAAPFRTDTGWVVHSPDQELSDVTEANLKRILPRMVMEILYSALAYGVSFQELVWERKTKYELGLSSSKSGVTSYIVAKVPNSVNPETVKSILRVPSDGSFNGFEQSPVSFNRTETITVEREAALVIPYNGRFRNLWGESFLLPIYPLWFWYEVVMRSMVRYMHRMATPVTVVKAPGKGKVNKPGTTTQVNPMVLGLAIAGNAANSNALVIPSDVDPETKQPLWDIFYLKADSPTQPFIDVLEFLTQSMLRAALSGDRAMTQPTEAAGSNLGPTHAAFTQLHNELILDQVIMYLNQYFMPLYSLYNKGTGGPPVFLETQGLDPMERDNMFKLMGIAGNSQVFQEFFYYVDWKRMAENNSVPVLSDEEVTAMKEKLNQEALDKQEAFQEVQAKFAPAQKPGGIKDAQKPPEKQANAKLEATDLDHYYEYVGKILSGEPVPIMLTREEIDLIAEHRGFDEETIKLFNPFHDRLGKFASRSGGGGGAGQTVTEGGSGSGGGGKSTEEVKTETIKKASRLGKVVKTTGKVLGLGTLGVVGLAVLGGVALASGTSSIEPGDELPEGEGEIDIPPGSDQQEKLAEVNRQIEDLTKNWPKFESPQQGIDYLKSKLSEMGVTDIPPDLKLAEQGLDPGVGGQYDAETNTLIMNANSEVLANFMDGDPAAIWMVAHEIAHSAQEVSHETNQAFGSSEGFGPEIINNDIFRQNVEGQNDLVTAITMSKMYGEPITQSGAAELHNQYDELQSTRTSLETGTRLFDMGNEIQKLAYEDEATYWAGVATAMAQTQGGTPESNLLQAHNQGFDPQYSYGILMNLFPSQMSDGGYYQETQEGGFLGIGATTVVQKEFPPPQQVEQWLRDQYGIDSDSAFNQMLQEAVDQ